jgi:FlaA1/EpsC-like NDP-sugar epimerase
LKTIKNYLPGLFKFDVVRLLTLFLDILFLSLSVAFSYSLVFDNNIPAPFVLQGIYTLAMLISSSLAFMSLFRVYSRKVPDFNEREFRVLILALGLSSLIVFLFMNAIDKNNWIFFPAFFLGMFLGRALLGIWASYRSVLIDSKTLVLFPLILGAAFVLLAKLPFFRQIPIINADIPVSKTIALLSFFLILFSCSSIRVLLRKFWALRRMRRSPVKKALLVGTGEGVLAFLKVNDIEKRYSIIGVLDRDKTRKGLFLNSVRVLGNPSDILQFAEDADLDAIILTDSALPKTDLNLIRQLCKERGLQLLRMEGVRGLLSGAGPLALEDLSMNKILERSEYLFVPNGSENYLRNKVVLITGAGGSIGSELSRQVANCEPSMLLLLGKGEHSIYLIERELKADFPSLQIRAIIASVTDAKSLKCIFEEHKPKIVLHAAAHKHVPLMEENVSEAIYNNVIGTNNIADTCWKFNVERFVLISSDKAVNPSSVMGATKRLAEMRLLSYASKYPTTIFNAVRFGNVLGSRGSVIPIFLEQIRSGGPVTITHPDMKRYFMSIPEASSLVLSAGMYKESGKIFVLEMGEQLRITDIAKGLIRQCGLVPGEDIEIKYTGIRPGEKLSELLSVSSDQLESTDTPKLKVLKGVSVMSQLSDEDFQLLGSFLSDKSSNEIRKVLFKMASD